MKLAILSRAPRAYSTQRLRTAALDRGHQVRVLNTLRFAIDLSGPEPDLQFRGRPISDYDAVLPRIGNSITYFGTAVVRQFEQMDVYTPNTANGISNARDKAPRRADPLAPPDRHACNDVRAQPRRRHAGHRARRRGSRRHRLLEGTQGIGVILAPDIKIAEAIIETLHSTKQNVLIQSLRHREPGTRHPRPRRRRPRRGGDAAARQWRRVPLQRPPRRHRRGGRA